MAKRAQRDGWYRELILKFEDGREEIFMIEMTRSGTFMLSEMNEPAEWTRLEHHKCESCPLSTSTEYCPAAESLETTLMRFKERNSFEKVMANAVDGAGRRTVVDGTLQEVGSVFVQLAVFSSSCPIGKKLRPLLNDLRPFATNNELTRFLVTKMLLKNRGDIDNAKREILRQLEPLHEVFSKLWARLEDQKSAGDAVQNSIVRMDAFTMNVSLQVDNILGELADDMGWDPNDTKQTSIGDLYDEDNETVKKSFLTKLKELFK